MSGVMRATAVALALLLHIVAAVPIGNELERLSNLYEKALLTKEQFEKAKEAALAASSASEPDTLGLTAAVAKIMLGKKMVSLLATMCRMEAQRSTSPKRLLSGDGVGGVVTCTLQNCGEAATCAEWNREIDNVDDCAQCGLKKFSVNELHACTCEYTCEAAAPAPPASAAEASLSLPAANSGGNVTADVDGVELWLEAEAGAIAFGRTADVRLFKDDGKRLRVNADLTVDGNVQVGGTVDGVDVGAFKDAFDALQLSFDQLVAGQLEAASLRASNVVQLGAGADEGCTDAAAAGSLRFEPGAKLVEVCTGEAWTTLSPPPQPIMVARVVNPNADMWKGSNGKVTRGSRGAGGNYMRDIREWAIVIDDFQAQGGSNGGVIVELVVNIFMSGGGGLNGAAGVDGSDYQLVYAPFTIHGDLSYQHTGGACPQGTGSGLNGCQHGFGPMMQHNDDGQHRGTWYNGACCCSSNDAFGWYGGCGFGQFGFIADGAHGGRFAHPIDRHGLYRNPPVGSASVEGGATISRKEFWLRPQQ